MSSTTSRTTLDMLPKGKKAQVVQIRSRKADRMREMGLLEGGFVKLCFTAPYGKDPIAIHTRGTTLALRRSEAAEVEIEIIGDENDSS